MKLPGITLWGIIEGGPDAVHLALVDMWNPVPKPGLPAGERRRFVRDSGRRLLCGKGFEGIGIIAPVGHQTIRELVGDSGTRITTEAPHDENEPDALRPADPSTTPDHP